MSRFSLKKVYYSSCYLHSNKKKHVPIEHLFSLLILSSTAEWGSVRYGFCCWNLRLTLYLSAPIVFKGCSSVSPWTVYQFIANYEKRKPVLNERSLVNRPPVTYLASLKDLPNSSATWQAQLKVCRSDIKSSLNNSLHRSHWSRLSYCTYALAVAT